MSKQITITLSDVQVSDINELVGHMRDANFTQAVGKCLEQGITQLAYRYKRNATKWVEAKQNKQLLNMLLEERKEWMKAKAEQEADDVVARD